MTPPPEMHFDLARSGRSGAMFFLVMRRMRIPLLLLIFTYAIAVGGLVLIPGQDADGQPWRMGFFHAFYVVSYTATTIGFGEIPYPFTDTQRLWLTFSIYLTVVVWIYSIGTLIALVQDSAFRDALVEARFARRVAAIREEFCLVCGYGETGRELVRALTEQGTQVVVVEPNRGKISQLKMDALRMDVPCLQGDASRPIQLLEAGLMHPLCRSVAAVTNSNEVNLKVAISAKLLHPSMNVICRADSHEVEANMRSFGTDHVVDPFDSFALHLALAFESPCLHLLHEWFSGKEDRSLCEPIYPPRNGLWVVCGYGRFGKAVCDRLRREGMRVRVVEAEPDKTGTPPDGVVRGHGTESAVLIQAGIEHAVGVVAGTNDDVTNLSVVITARGVKPNLFVVLRQNLDENKTIVDAVNADIVMNPSVIIANRIRRMLVTPLLGQFLSLALHEDERWACNLLSRVSGLVEEETPEVWQVRFVPEEVHAVFRSELGSDRVRLDHLVRDPRDRGRYIHCIPLLLHRGHEWIPLPNLAEPVEEEDEVLFCGGPGARSTMTWTLQNMHALAYVMNGESPPGGHVWRWLRRKMA